MKRTLDSFYLAAAALLLPLWLVLLTPLSNRELFAADKPDWVDGLSARYPEASYLSGAGFGDSRQTAENSAYAAIARIFRSEVRSVNREEENFRQTEKEKKVGVDRKIDIRNQTEVSTQKVLEQVQIVERWVDPISKVHYALAVLDRSKAASSLRQKADAAEMEAKEWEKRAEKSPGKLEKVRALRKAMLAAAVVEEYEGDLRVIQPGRSPLGVGLVRSTEMRRQLAELLGEHFRVGVHIRGPHASAVQDAILASLHEKGFTSGSEEEIVISGQVDFQEAESQDPKWHFVRWTAHLTLEEKETGKTFGSINRSGREGQLSPNEASRRALFVLQTEMNQTVGEKLLQFIYGE
jgi:hypothetical protein